MSTLTIRFITILVLLYLNEINSLISGRTFGAGTVKCGKQASGKYLTLSSKNENPLPNECIYTIKARSAYVCQLRVDFDTKLAQPTIPSSENNLTFPECLTDYLDIGSFKICGINQQQHIYLSFNKTSGVKTVQLIFRTSPRNISQEIPSWNLKITQLECSKGSPLRNLLINSQNYDFTDYSNDLLSSVNEGIARTFFKDGFNIAPNGCTQYYPESIGKVETFNFLNGSGTYIGNVTYAICFRRTAITRKLSLTFNYFELGFDSTNNTLEQLDKNCLPQIETIGHSEDYLMISNSKIEIDNIRATYFCGQSLHRKKIISNTVGPLKIIFNSDNIYAENKPEIGFSFNYEII